MPTTLTNGIQLPDKGSVDWYNSMQSNYNLIDTHLGNTDTHVTAEDKANWNSKQGSLSQAQLDAIAQVSTNTSDIATLQSGKANASHTHSSSDITDIGDYATKQYVDNSISGLVDNAPAALDTLNELSAALNDDSNFASTVTTALSAKANSVDLATVATSGSYNDLSNKPSIPTKTSDLTNDSNFVDTSNSAVASGITSAKVTSYDSHIADTDIHVTTADKTKWNNGVSQSYVFRYSSSSVTDNSTIAYSTIDNTDNIKSGDKILDVDGKLFEITSVDTTNQTVTVGSALIDLALDANVVHTSGNETISGDKVFNNRLIKNIDVVLGTAPSTGKFSNIDIADNNKASLLQILGGVYDTGQSYARFFVQNKTADDGTGLSPTGTLRTCGFNINLPASSTSEGQGSITPRANKTTDFGLLSYQWRNVWCEKLYLNGTQLDPSAFVTTDTAQTISGQKVFSDINAISSSAEIGVSSGNNSFKVLDKNKKTISSLDGGTFSSGMAYSYWLVNNGSDVFNGVTLYQPSANLAQLRPYNSTLSLQLGASNRYFSDCYTSKINGLTPSSLGMPDIANKIDISGYVTDLTGAGNEYTPPVNGWICVRSGNANKISILDSGTNIGNTSISNTATYLTLITPCVANRKVFINIMCTSLDFAYFIPCQGNI